MAASVDGNLGMTLAEVRERIAQVRDRKQCIGEQNTKAILIDPIISALGWNLADWDEVCREYRSKPQDNPVDYALLSNRTPRLFVEAKDLNASLGDRKWIAQVVSYATVVGVKWCVLTNGDEYRLYNAHAPVDVEKKLFRSVRISDASQDSYTSETLDLLSRDKMGQDLIGQYWREHFVDREVEAALYDLLQNDDANLIRLIRKKSPELAPAEIRDSLERASIQISFPSVSVAGPVSPPTDAFPGRPEEEGAEDSADTDGISLADIIHAGLINPPIHLEKRYKGVRLTATIQSDGRVLYDGKLYGSPSVSASMARKSVIGAPRGRKYPNTNGWRFWRYCDSETGKLEQLDKLRLALAAKRVT